MSREHLPSPKLAYASSAARLTSRLRRSGPTPGGDEQPVTPSLPGLGDGSEEGTGQDGPADQDGPERRGPRLRRIPHLVRRLPAPVRHLALPVTLVVGIAVVTLINHFSGHDWGDDFALYLRQAKALAIGNVGEVVSDNRFAIENSAWSTFSPYTYPWGWPLVLAPLYAVFGLDYEVFKFVEVLAFCLFLLTFFALVRPRAGAIVATLLTTLIGLSPIYIGGTGAVLSDIPYLGLVGLSLWWIDRVRTAGLLAAPRNHLVAIGLLLAFTYNVRREGVTLVIALAALHLATWAGAAWRARSIRIWGRPEWRKVSVPYASFALAAIGFHLVLPTVLLPSAPGTGLSNISARLTYYREIFAQQIGLQDPGSPLSLFGSEQAAHRVLVVLVILGVLGMVARLLTETQSDVHLAAFLGCSSLLMLVSPYQEGRYLYTITPLLMYFAYQAIPAVAGRPATGGSVARASAVLPAVALAGFVGLNIADTVRSTRYHLDYSYVVHGPESPDAQQMFAAVKERTRADDVILFFRSRAMTLYSDRRSVMGSDLELLLPRSDWYVMAKDSTYSQKLLTDDEAAAYGLTKVWENEGWVMWRVPPSSP